MFVLLAILTVNGAQAASGDGGSGSSAGGGSSRKYGGNVSLNFPHPIFVEAAYRPIPMVSLGLGAGGLALNNLKFGNTPISLSMLALDFKGRWHPFQGSFFLGLGLGYQRMSGKMTDTIPVQANGQTTNVLTTVALGVNSPYLTPQLGWFWVWSGGFTLGFDLGIQVPFVPQTSLDITTDNTNANIGIAQIQATTQYRELEAKVQDAGNKIGRQSLPMVTAIRIGWMF